MAQVIKGRDLTQIATAAGVSLTKLSTAVANSNVAPYDVVFELNSTLSKIADHYNKSGVPSTVGPAALVVLSSYGAVLKIYDDVTQSYELVETETILKPEGDYVPPIIEVVGVSISGPTSLLYGAKGSYTAAPIPSDAEVKTKVWSVSNTEKGSITQTGKFTPLAGKSGGINIRCTINGIVLEYPIVMQDEVITLTGITLTGPSGLAFGEGGKYVATPVPANATFDNLTFSVSDASVASITQGGTVSTSGSGSFDVIATDGSVSETFSVTVSEDTTGAYQQHVWSDDQFEWAE